MKERPILFTPENVRAILDGRKTQTRRIVKSQPTPIPEGPSVAGVVYTAGWFEGMPTPDYVLKACPYGVPGDRLWVRESYRFGASWEGYKPKDVPVGTDLTFESDQEDGFWGKLRPSIHMPRWACRLVLELTEVRVERLQACSELDAIAEGVKPCGHTSFHVDEHTCSYKDLWASINGADSWDLNPWVWVIAFRRAS